MKMIFRCELSQQIAATPWWKVILWPSTHCYVEGHQNTETWGKCPPNGDIKLHMIRPEVGEGFEMGKLYEVEIRESEDQDRKFFGSRG